MFQRILSNTISSLEYFPYYIILHLHGICIRTPWGSNLEGPDFRGAAHRKNLSPRISKETALIRRRSSGDERYYEGSSPLRELPFSISLEIPPTRRKESSHTRRRIVGLTLDSSQSKCVDTFYIPLSISTIGGYFRDAGRSRKGWDRGIGDETGDRLSTRLNTASPLDKSAPFVLYSSKASKNATSDPWSRVQRNARRLTTAFLKRYNFV